MGIRSDSQSVRKKTKPWIQPGLVLLICLGMESEVLLASIRPHKAHCRCHVWESDLTANRFERKQNLGSNPVWSCSYVSEWSLKFCSLPYAPTKRIAGATYGNPI